MEFANKNWAALSVDPALTTGKKPVYQWLFQKHYH